jgi:hypothetical protein
MASFHAGSSAAEGMPSPEKTMIAPRSNAQEIRDLVLLGGMAMLPPSSLACYYPTKKRARLEPRAFM